jgi:hypothetical protein
MHGGGIFGKGWISFSYMYTSKNWGGNPTIDDILNLQGLQLFEYYKNITKKDQTLFCDQI